MEQSKPTQEDAFDPTELWRNEDVAEPTKKFLVRVDSVKLALKQPVMPKQLNNKLLASKSRDGTNYCALFQSQECKEEAVSLLRADGRQADCKFGLHSCAVIFKSGRMCHGDHPAIKCEQTRGLAPIPGRGSVGSPNLLPRNPAAAKELSLIHI